MGFELDELKEHNADLLELLTKHLPDMLWVKDVEGKYLYANQAICDGLLMAKDTNEPIGKGDVFFALREREAHKENPEWHTFGELCFNSDQVVIDEDKPMKFEEYGNVKGKLLYLEVYKAPFYDKDGKIIGTVGAGRDITELKKTQMELEESVKKLKKQKELIEYKDNHDSLTHLPNRALLLDRIEQAIKVAQVEHSSLSLLSVDIDQFKEINDSLGHKVGDKVLTEFSKRLKRRVKKTDTLARISGDQFCVVLNEIHEIDDITDVVYNLQEAVKKPFEIDEHTLYISVSIGISIYPHDGQKAIILLKNADTAMFRAKEKGRMAYAFYDEEMTKVAFERITLETQLREALKKDELLVYFQPQINSSTNSLIGMEALVRWEHPTMGLVSPDKFIHLAETTGMIVELDRIVIEKSILQFHKWYEEDLNPGKLSLNLAIKQMEDDGFVDFIGKLLKDKVYLYKKLEFEITESQIMANPEAAINTLQQMSKLGITIAVDDFGTGYSSLSYLKKLPINKLKIDKSFIDELPYDSEDVAITKTIISLQQNLNLEVIAEGVETQEQIDFLKEHNCENIQGYFYSQPLSIDGMTKHLRDYKALGDYFAQYSK